jgi:hypothetical protein
VKVIVVASGGTEYTQFSDDLNCNHLVMVVPVKPTAKSSIPATSDKLMCDYKLGKDSGLLRNEFSQAYLSILGDTRQEGLPIILDVEWRNNSGQRWRFFDNQLMNGHGKCFRLGLEDLLYSTSMTVVEIGLGRSGTAMACKSSTDLICA